MDDEVHSPIFFTMRNYWSFPVSLQADSGVVLAARQLLRDDMKVYLREISLSGIQCFWLSFLAMLWTPKLHTCPSCFNVFPAKASCQKKCVGCYYGSPSTGFSMERVKSVDSFDVWMKVCESMTEVDRW